MNDILCLTGNLEGAYEMQKMNDLTMLTALEILAMVGAIVAVVVGGFVI